MPHSRSGSVSRVRVNMAISSAATVPNADAASFVRSSAGSSLGRSPSSAGGSSPEARSREALTRTPPRSRYRMRAG
jgi:hypothetical protein